jgi:hypothetical protein
MKGALFPFEPRYAELDGGEPEKVVVIDRSNVEINTPTVRDRLVKAGIRLGALLNQALGH